MTSLYDNYDHSFIHSLYDNYDHSFLLFIGVFGRADNVGQFAPITLSKTSSGQCLLRRVNHRKWDILDEGEDTASQNEV